MKIIAFFEGKSDGGELSLVYHLAWMYRRLGLSVVVLDVDPEPDLTSAFLAEERLAELWVDEQSRGTIFGSVRPLLDRTGDVSPPNVELVSAELLGPNIGLVPGDPSLASFEEQLGEAWLRCLDERGAHSEEALRVTTSFHRVALAAAQALRASLVLVDLGPGLGAINRAALVASDHVVVALGAELFSFQRLKSLGPTLRRWREGWELCKKGRWAGGASWPAGEMKPAGYAMVLQHAVRQGPLAPASRPWMRCVPAEYSASILQEPAEITEPSSDPHCLGVIRRYPSLTLMARDARKPMFELTPADGAFGSHAKAVQDCLESFELLARRIAGDCGIALPS